MTFIERLLVEAAMFFRAEPEEFVVFKKPDRNIAQKYIGSLAP